MELPRYKCHKVVSALKIKSLFLQDGDWWIVPVDGSYVSFKVSEEWFTHRYHGTDSDRGYFMLYEDGYQSWSPSKAFEEGYTKIE